MVKQIVNDSIVEKDEKSCEYILARMYHDQAVRENRLDLQSAERQRLRSRIKSQHNQTREFEKKCGVRLGTLGLKEKTVTFSQCGSRIEGEEEEEFKLKFNPRVTESRNNARDQVLSQPKPEFQGTDFFQRSEFRGLLLADYQEVLGAKGKQAVTKLNETQIDKFSTLKSF
jgi:hypothetical protein